MPREDPHSPVTIWAMLVTTGHLWYSASFPELSTTALPLLIITVDHPSYCHTLVNSFITSIFTELDYQQLPDQASSVAPMITPCSGYGNSGPPCVHLPSCVGQPSLLCDMLAPAGIPRFRTTLQLLRGEWNPANSFSLVCDLYHFLCFSFLVSVMGITT